MDFQLPPASNSHNISNLPEQDALTMYLAFVGKGDILPFTEEKKNQLAQTLLASLALDANLKYDASYIS